MEETRSRIIITEDKGKTIIFIKPHNSIFHAFIVLLILTSVFMALVFIFAMLAVAFKTGIIITFLSFALAAVSLIYKIVAAIISLRSLLWTLAGGETIVINDKEFIYSKKTAGMGPRVTIQKNEVQSITVIDYIREKDVIHMIESEIRIRGRSFELKTAKRTLKFGIYISMDDSDALDKVFKLVL